MAHKELFGYTERVSFSRIPQVLELPDLIAVQKEGYKWFLEEGLKEVLEDLSPIEDYAGSLILEFADYKMEDETKYTEQEAKERDANYSSPLKVKVRLINKDTGELKEQEVFMGDFPKMTHNGTFIINGAERVIVSQLVRSPGVYYNMEVDKSGNKLFSSTVIPNRGAWIEYETDAAGVINARIDRTRKLPISTLIRALICDTKEEMIELFGDIKELNESIDKEPKRDSGAKDDTNHSIYIEPTREDALLEIYKKLKPGDPAAIESAEPLIHNLFFDPKRYDLAKVGRYKFNKKLGISARITGFELGQDAINPETGEIVFEKGKILSEEDAIKIENAGINTIDIINEGQTVRVTGNHFVDLAAFDIKIDLSDIGLSEKVYYPVMKEILAESYENDDELKRAIKRRKNELSPRHITRSDIMATVSYEFNLSYGVGSTDDIDHLGNRRVRNVGELLQNQFRIGISRMERVVRERMSTQDPDLATPQALINIRPVTAAMKEFFGSSQLSQFMDQTNPLAELTHKRRMSALGPGGLSRERAGAEVRDVHDSHYGRICPIETPEGPNIGLITSMTTYARINKYGFIETPYRIVDKKNGIVTDDFLYLTSDQEDRYIIA